VSESAIEIRSFEHRDLDAVVDFALRAWEPIFSSVREVLGDDLFLRLHPDWRESQAEAVRSSCTNDERDVFVAVADNRPVGFVAVALNAFHEGMGWIDIIGVDPDYQRRG
jgi:GNAT superfamily N-acetyltransferase